MDLFNFRFNTNTEITFEQVNRTGGSGGVTVTNGNACLSLAEGVMHDVFVSSIVSGGEVIIVTKRLEKEI